MKRIRVWLRAMRVHQWTKNFVIPAAWFFAANDPSQDAMALGWRPVLLMFGMFGSFCFVSSCFYLLNDVADADKDRLHPVKRNRPIAAGLVSVSAAKRAAFLLYLAGLVPPLVIFIRHFDRWQALAVMLGYSLMQTWYSRWGLKKVPYVDALVVAAGFGLRAAGGTTALAVRLSPWLLASVTALSLFLALCKRRHEKILSEDSRDALKGYDVRVLNVLIGLMSVATFGVYLAYTCAAETLHRFASADGRLAWTALPVAAGLIRYLHLTYSKADVGRPERILLTDRILWVILFSYVAVTVWVFGPWR